MTAWRNYPRIVKPNDFQRFQWLQQDTRHQPKLGLTMCWHFYIVMPYLNTFCLIPPVHIYGWGMGIAQQLKPEDKG